jgi:hypothetical protein
MVALIGSTNQVIQVRVFSTVELQSAGNPFKDSFGHAFAIAPFEPGVVLDTHTGNKGNFFPSKSGHATSAAEVWQSDLVWGEPGPTCHKKFAEVIPKIHATSL